VLKKVSFLLKQFILKKTIINFIRISLILKMKGLVMKIHRNIQCFEQLLAL